MNYFLNFNDIVSQKLFLFQNFVDNVRFKFMAFNRMPLTIDTCPEIKNIRLSTNFKLYNFSEICIVYSNFLKDKFTNNLNTKNWNQKEKNLFIWILIYIIETNNRPMNTLMKEDWLLISNLIVRSERECILKWNSFLKSDPQLIKWSEQDDNLLVQIMKANSESKIKWNDIAILLYKNSQSGFFRSGRKCRERWINCLSPALVKTKWTQEEDYQLLTNTLKFGKRWSLISKMIKGRNEHSIKYHFFSLMKKYGAKAGEETSEETFSQNALQEIFGILEKMKGGSNSEDKTTNFNNSSSSSSGDDDHCNKCQNQALIDSVKVNPLGPKQPGVSNFLKYLQRIEDNQINFKEDLLSNSNFGCEKIENKKRKTYQENENSESSDEEMKELWGFHHQSSKKQKNI